VWDVYAVSGQRDRAVLPVARQQLFAICDLRQEVMSGGFDSYFRYWGGNTAKRALVGLSRYLGPDWASLLRGGMSLFGADYPGDADERARIIDERGLDDALSVLDSRIQELEARDDVDALLTAAIRDDHRAPRSRGDAATPLTLVGDKGRVVAGRPAPLGANGKPLVQPWAVGSGRIIAMVLGSTGLAVAFFFAPLSLALGGLGFVLANAAWAHLRNANHPRRLALAGQIVNGAAMGVSLILIVMWIVGKS
jgi:hypothetical protein